MISRLLATLKAQVMTAWRSAGVDAEPAPATFDTGIAGRDSLTVSKAQAPHAWLVI
tara:strand:+ start:1041 stop:1208 length:168 start_codon:yes stop_codon:yes gene_type:complete